MFEKVLVGKAQGKDEAETSYRCWREGPQSEGNPACDSMLMEEWNNPLVIECVIQ